ncbi:MAG: gamma-glutamylcyclotransferase family protein [Marinomonas sp.]
MPTNIVAVYGTLREGLTNHKLIAGCKRIGLGWLTGFRMYNLGEYPGVIPTHDESGRIRVEWYDVPDDILEELDRLEEFDPDALQTSLYLRKRVFSPYGQGWIYIYNQPLSSAPYMEAGDWERFTRENKESKPVNNTYKQEESHHYGQAIPA